MIKIYYPHPFKMIFWERGTLNVSCTFLRGDNTYKGDLFQSFLQFSPRKFRKKITPENRFFSLQLGAQSTAIFVCFDKSRHSKQKKYVKIESSRFLSKEGAWFLCETIPIWYLSYQKLGGGFKYFLFSPLGKWPNLTCAYFSNGLVQPPTSQAQHNEMPSFLPHLSNEKRAPGC